MPIIKRVSGFALRQGAATLGWFAHAFSPAAVFIDLVDGRYVQRFDLLKVADYGLVADLFKAIRGGKASVVTDRIETFTAKGIRLASGTELEADLIVTATGLDLQVLGGVELTVDRRRIDPAETFNYKGLMYSGVPNLASSFGYTNASWTLKCDLTCEYVCRLLNHMKKHGYRQCTPRNADPELAAEPWVDFSSGYVQRTMHLFPKQGSKAPWRLHQNYARDILTLRYGRVDELTAECEELRANYYALMAFCDHQLGTLLDWVEGGEEVVITRRGKAVARLVPNDSRPNVRQAQERARRGVFDRDERLYDVARHPAARGRFADDAGNQRARGDAIGNRCEAGGAGAFQLSHARFLRGPAEVTQLLGGEGRGIELVCRHAAVAVEGGLLPNERELFLLGRDPQRARRLVLAGRRQLRRALAPEIPGEPRQRELRLRVVHDDQVPHRRGGRSGLGEVPHARRGEERRLHPRAGEGGFQHLRHRPRDARRQGLHRR